jgi:hypothetical protein
VGLADVVNVSDLRQERGGRGRGGSSSPSWW